MQTRQSEQCVLSKIINHTVCMSNPNTAIHVITACPVFRLFMLSPPAQYSARSCCHRLPSIPPVHVITAYPVFRLCHHLLPSISPVVILLSSRKSSKNQVWINGIGAQLPKLASLMATVPWFATSTLLPLTLSSNIRRSLGHAVWCIFFTY